MLVKQSSAWIYRIYIAGDYATAKVTCRQFCMAYPGCVTVTPTEYVYTGGAESGVIVELINYARFPQDPENAYESVRKLADALRLALCQQSYTIMTPTASIWFSHRPEDNLPNEQK